jgi:hypothetical protein
MVQPLWCRNLCAEPDSLAAAPLPLSASKHAEDGCRGAARHTSCSARHTHAQLRQTPGIRPQARSVWLSHSSWQCAHACASAALCLHPNPPHPTSPTACPCLAPLAPTPSPPGWLPHPASAHAVGSAIASGARMSSRCHSHKHLPLAALRAGRRAVRSCSGWSGPCAEPDSLAAAPLPLSASKHAEDGCRGRCAPHLLQRKAHACSAPSDSRHQTPSA